MITKNTKVFAASLFLSFFFWLSINFGAQGLTNFFFWAQIAKNPEIMAAETFQAPLHKDISQQKPLKKIGAQDFQTSARAVLSVFVPIKILFQKDADNPFPIASLTKLMTALVAMQQYPLDQKITITKEAVDKEENIGNLKVGEVLTVKDLLYSMLMESSNDAAEALSGTLGNKEFLRLMNSEAQNIGLQKTVFADSAGVDPNNSANAINTSSARDLFLLTKYIFEYKPQILNILSLREYNLYAPNGKFHHKIENTDELLDNPQLPLKILGGKTGWTPLAKGCLLLIAQSPQENGYLINIVLGSDNRFEDMKNLFDWVTQSYDF